MKKKKRKKSKSSNNRSHNNVNNKNLKQSSVRDTSLSKQTNNHTTQGNIQLDPVHSAVQDHKKDYNRDNLTPKKTVAPYSGIKDSQTTATLSRRETSPTGTISSRTRVAPAKTASSRRRTSSAQTTMDTTRNSPANRSAPNKTISQKTNRAIPNQNKGLRLSKLAIQVALCILFYFVVYIVVIDYAQEAYDFAYQIFGDVCMEPSSKKKVKVTIPENASLKEVSSLLAEKELVKNEYSFYIRGKLSTNEKRKIIPGTYMLCPSDNYEDIFNVLTQSDNVNVE